VIDLNKKEKAVERDSGRDPLKREKSKDKEVERDSGRDGMKRDASTGSLNDKGKEKEGVLGGLSKVMSLRIKGSGNSKRSARDVFDDPQPPSPGSASSPRSPSSPRSQTVDVCSSVCIPLRSTFLLLSC